jgi:hypothetical protein
MIIKKGDTTLGIHPVLIDKLKESGFKEEDGCLKWDGVEIQPPESENKEEE